MKTLWFLVPSNDLPSGGLQNCHNLALIARDFGIESYVISEYPNKFIHKNSAWRTNQFVYDHIKDGDIVVTVEFWPERTDFSKKITRIKFAQNYSIEYGGWETDIWYYGQSNLKKCYDRLAECSYMNKENVNWLEIDPYFDREIFKQSLPLYERKNILFMDRRRSGHSKTIKSKFDDNVAINAKNLTINELVKTYNKASIFVYPTADESLGMPLVESMLCGCVPITYDYDYAREFITNDENGILVEPENVEDMIAATKALHKDTNRLIRLSKNASNSFNDRFIYEKTAGQFLKAYKSACSLEPTL